MTLRRTSFFALAAMLAITLTGLTAHAQTSPQALNLSDAQVSRIQALLFSQTKEIQTLTINVQSAQEALSAAVAQGDPVFTAMAVLTLDAAEKALKITQQANQRDLMALLSDSQKQLLKDSNKSVSTSD